VTQPPLLVWRAVKRARYYNVQLYRKGAKILSIWPARARLKLHKRWRYNGKSFRLRSGSYTWLVWPAYGTREKPRYGALLGQSTFKVVAR
jgi:hypothetical protein